MMDLDKFERIDGINVYRVKTFGRKEKATANNLCMASYLFFGFFKGLSLCWRNNYEFINTQFVLPTGPLGFALSKIFNLKNVLSIHGGDIYDPSLKRSPHRYKLLRKIVGFLINQSDYVVAQSNNTKKNAQTHYLFNKEIKIIPLPYEKFDFEKISKEKLGLKKDKIYLISVGRLVKRKNYEYFVRALAELPKNINGIILSDGPEKENLLKLAKKIGVENRLIMPGFVSDKEKFQYLYNSDIYVLSSLHEGFGIVIQEAMQVGLPIVATNNGGQTDLVKDRENGFLIRTRDYKAIADKVEKLLKNKELIEKISNKNKKLINNFSIKKIARQYLDLIE